ncbi:MAG TPA: nucleotide exchange factor GrpE [Verrucomicrobiales bacterium]|nr:nucleotide exchange factor GrpE [Verrucomicrobiales bacterium]HBE96228.1 nucleotide exchange factor GrpE [Verrucomicrobiales bacterium]
MQESAQETEPIEGEVPSSDEVVEEVELEKEEAESTEETPEEEVPLTPEAEALKWKEAAIRTAADLDNYRKRMARERSEDLRFARAGLIEELLPVFDNFSMGLQMAEQEQDSMIYKGMEMVKGQLDDFLAAQGLVEVPAEGIFDPNLHEAVAEEEKDGAEPGEILFVKRKGYRIHDRLLRAAVVVVARAPGTPTEEAE